MKLLVTGDPDKSRTKKLIKAIEKAGHTVVVSSATNRRGDLTINEILVDGDPMELGKEIKVERSHLSDRMRMLTPGNLNNRKARRSAAAEKQRRNK